MFSRVTAAEALCGANNLQSAAGFFAEAERLQEERQPGYPLLYSLQGYKYCDFLLSKERAADCAIGQRRPCDGPDR